MLGLDDLTLYMLQGGQCLHLPSCPTMHRKHQDSCLCNNGQTKGARISRLSALHIPILSTSSGVKSRKRWINSHTIRSLSSKNQHNFRKHPLTLFSPSRSHLEVRSQTPARRIPTCSTRMFLSPQLTPAMWDKYTQAITLNESVADSFSQ